jgi:hypothetical protein
MKNFRKLGSGFVCAMIVTSSLVAFSAPVAAAGSYPVPSNDTVCKLLVFAQQAAERIPNAKLKDAVLNQIDVQLAAYKCNAPAV